MSVGQMFDHTLTALKGWPRPTALDYVAQLSANVTISPVNAGTVVHVNSSGQFEMGTQLWQMPIYLLQGSADFDVSNPGASSSPWYAVSPSGWMSGLVATGGYELETTEFDTAQTYNPNDPLTSVLSNSAANGGSLTNQGIGTIFGVAQKSVVGIVSRGKYTNAYGKTVLGFWPVWFPGAV